MSTQTYVEQRPPALLTEFVSTQWTQRVPADAEPYLQRNTPNGSCEIISRLGAPPQIIGPRTVPTIDVLAPGTTVVGARLRPGAASAIFGRPAHELVDCSVTFAELDCPGLGQFEEPLSTARSPSEAIGSIERALLARAALVPTIDWVVSEAVHRLEGAGHGGLSVIRSEQSLSERHFRRRIRDAVGLAPKVLERMLRFQRVLAWTQFGLARSQDSSDESVAALAATTGYADESHLNRECRALTGLSIGKFLAETHRHCGCGHDHGASFNRILGIQSGVRPNP